MPWLNLLTLGLFCLLAVRFAVVGWSRISLNANSADGDQAAYLQIGLDIREHGQLTDGKRPPLYPALLALFASRTWSYFTWAKILGLAFSLVTLVGTYEIGRRLFNQVTGLLAAFLLAINTEFVLHSAIAMAEPLLVLIVLAAWYTMLRALQQPDRLSYWVWAGILSGLAYLTKGTGPIFPLCFVIIALLLPGFNLLRRRVFWAFVAAAVIAAAPLWLYNFVHFGSPLYNSAIENVMWMDSSEEKYISDEAELPTIVSYFQENSLEKIWTRLGEGLLAMRFFYAKVLWPTRSLTFDHFLLAGGLDILVGALLVLSIVFRQHVWPLLKRQRAALLLTGSMIALFYVLFAWYLPASPYPIRFLIPLLPLMLLLLSASAVSLFRHIWAAPGLPQWGRIALGLLGLICAAWLAQWFVITGVSNAQAATRNPFDADAEFNDYNEQALVWARQGHDSGDTVTVLWGPSHNLTTWRLSDFFRFVRTPLAATSVAQLEAYAQSEDVTYIIMDDDMARRRRNLAEDLQFTRGDGELLTFDTFPADWALGLTAPAYPCRWCVFRRLNASPAITPTDYRLADESIHLFGYEIDTENFRAGGQLQLALYWKTQRAIPLNYTIFTQLLGPDFQLHGQVDRQPLNGQWPTSRWQPGQKFVDKFVLEIDPNAPQGSYVLLIGLYDLNTGERAIATHNHQAINDNAIPLLNLSLN